MTREEKSWILYDVANSAYSLIIVTAIMPIFFKSYAATGMSAHDSTAWWGIANSIAALLIACISPVLGAVADCRGAKKQFFTIFLLIGLAATGSLTMVSEGGWITALVIFTISYIGFAGANLFYDSFLVDVTSKKQMDWISSCGYSLGYIGSVIPMIAVMLIIYFGDTINMVKLSFLITASWWLLFALPTLFNVREKYVEGKTLKPVSQSLRQLFNTLREIIGDRQILLFLLAYFFYIDGIDTVIRMAIPYGKDLGFKDENLMILLLVVQVVAFPCALAYGRLAKRFTPTRMIAFGISVYIAITAAGALLPQISSRPLRLGLFWVLAIMIGSSQGGVQALSRSYFGKIVPHDKASEYFGFYNIFGKFSTIAGPFLMGAGIKLTGSAGIGLLCILPLFLVGAVLLKQSTSAKKAR